MSSTAHPTLRSEATFECEFIPPPQRADYQQQNQANSSSPSGKSKAKNPKRDMNHANLCSEYSPNPVRRVFTLLKDGSGRHYLICSELIALIYGYKNTGPEYDKFLSVIHNPIKRDTPNCATSDLEMNRIPFISTLSLSF